MMWMTTLLNWVRGDFKRFIWEVVLAITLAGVSWGVGYLLNSRTLEACQDERAVLLKQSQEHQAQLDKIHYEGLLGAKDLELSKKDEEFLELKRKMASDSIKHLSDLQAMRAINDYIKGKR